MSYDEIDSDEANARQQAGWRYVDVRSPQEFAEGHPVGAVNIPILFLGPMGMSPNPDFIGAVLQHFPPETPLVMGCKSGGRSARACLALAQHGYQQLANVAGGFHGAPGLSGWRARGLPESSDTSGVSWDDLKG